MYHLFYPLGDSGAGVNHPPYALRDSGAGVYQQIITPYPIRNSGMHSLRDTGSDVVHPPYPLRASVYHSPYIGSGSGVYHQAYSLGKQQDR